jgi:sugar/nucleoside kinase (ribokinase family)
VSGTVTIDYVRASATPVTAQLGGSAMYSALAAANYVDVSLVAAVGADAESMFREALGSSGVDTESVEVFDAPNFSWIASYDPVSGEAREEAYDEGASASWWPRMSTRAARCQVVFVGSMRPDLQAEILSQTRAELIGIDSRTPYLRDRSTVMSMVQRVDVLFLNLAELSFLTERPESEWRNSARSLVGLGRLRAVVVKAGSHGAAYVSEAETLKLAAHRVDRVIDPTGAGDALAGAFLGVCARERRSDDQVLAVALQEGLYWAAHAIRAPGLAGLKRPM